MDTCLPDTFYIHPPQEFRDAEGEIGNHGGGLAAVGDARRIAQIYEIAVGQLAPQGFQDG